MSTQRCTVANHDEFFLRAGHCYVRSPDVSQKTNLPFIVAANKAYRNDVAFLALKCIDRIDSNVSINR